MVKNCRPRLTIYNFSPLFFLFKKFSDFKVAQKAGVARTFQNIRLFPQMSVLENMMVAQHNKLMKASGFTITYIKVYEIKKWFGRYFFILFEKDKPGILDF